MRSRKLWFCFLGITLLPFACIPANAVVDNEWKRIDHNGIVSEIPAAAIDMPKWAGWIDKSESVYGRQLLYRSKKTADGSELRFSPNHSGPPISDRYEITSISKDDTKRQGFVDGSGRIVVEPKFSQVQHFYNNLVAVREKRGEPWKILDKNGNLKYTLPLDISPEMSNRFWGVSKEGLLSVRKGDADAPHGGGIDGLYDLAKKEFYPLGAFTVICDFAEGLSCFNSTGPMLHGYADTHGKIVIPKQFEEAWSFHNGRALVRLGKQRGLIDHKGEFVVKFPEQFIRVDPFHDGLAAVVVKNDQGAFKMGFIDETGKLVIPAIYSVSKTWYGGFTTAQFSEGLINVTQGDEVNHQYGFIDREGHWKIQPKYREAEGFNEGYARVKLGPSGFNKVEWDKNLNRVENFRLALRQNKIVGASRQDLKTLLGKADKRYIDSDVYTLYSGFCGNEYKAVELHFDNDKVTKYRALGYESHGAWMDKVVVDDKK